MLLSSTPSHTATTILTTQRVSDSGVEILDVERMDIAERAKLRSRGRSQAKGKQITYDDVIELSSSDDELSLPKSKPKPKPKPKAKKPAAPKESGSDKGKLKGKSRVPSKPSPSKRAKTTHIPDGPESDVDTIPVATSDFPIPAQQPPLPPLPPHIRHLSSQLPPSDPPPSTSGSSAPRTSQDRQLNANADRFRDESPLSSPPPPMPRKRKRPSPPNYIPGLDDEDNSYMGADDDSILAGPAPGGMVPVVEITRVPKKSRSKGSDPPLPPPSPGVVPETQLADPPAEHQEKPAPQKKKRKRVVEDGEEWDAGLDEELLAQAVKSKSKKRSRADEEDEEEYGASSSKAKAKAKKDKEKPAKKAAKEKVPPKEKGTKGKANAKGKASSSSSKGVVEGSDTEEMSISIDGDKVRDAMPPPPAPEPASKHKEKDRPSSSKGTSDDPGVPVDVSAPKRGKGKQRALILSDDEDDGAHTADVSTNASAADASLDIDWPPPARAKKGGRKSAGGEQGSKLSCRCHINSSAGRSRDAAAPPHELRTVEPRIHDLVQEDEVDTHVRAHPAGLLAPRLPFSRVVAPDVLAACQGVEERPPAHRTVASQPPDSPASPSAAPPPKKSKKMLELEEKWEMELEDSIDGWYAMSEEERATLRRAKRDHELGFED
ncbi:hypothetical protein GSI_02417 [Ganoderma sinense ZZ0214-1]|uniref:Uncharacterized protein n=1 Tax=Ganoderma sinense ZZ0214-1 TaxID=1077348 RepID=A0A2G8SPI7_9APHY|nr:hypothetical protein GSI_02417 [Ganoderma sinense ZZ0214-1]